MRIPYSAWKSPWLACAAMCVSLQAAEPSRLSGAVEALKNVAAAGAGHESAMAAWQVLAKTDASSIPFILESMDGANDYAINWLRSAVETIAQRSAEGGGRLSVESLTAFVHDTRHHPRARRLAYELIARTDPAAGRALLPGFLNDPGPELRRDAVEQVTTQAGADLAAGRKEQATAAFQKAIAYARDVDQVDAIAKKLGELGQPVNLQKTFGWVTRWKVIAPFDNAGGAGFDRVFPPETGVDPGVELDGKNGKVQWRELETKDDYGKVDFNKAFTALKGAAGYAYAEVESDVARPVEIRLGCKNGWKIWVNGTFLFGRDEYHRGAAIDQYRLKSALRAGRNTILVKLCQNEQTETWASEWEFQLRVTDAVGTPVAFSR